MTHDEELTGRIEPFDSFWEAPRDVERGYDSFARFYRWNYLKYLPDDRNAPILVVSCGPGYLLNLLREQGYMNVFGIDSDPEKIRPALARDLSCRRERAFSYLKTTEHSYDLIFCEQELNHLTKKEILRFLGHCYDRLSDGGRLIVHVLNGANPITGSEALAQNFDHYNSFTEYSLRQVLTFARFRDVAVFPLHLYVFRMNPINYIAWALSSLLNLCFHLTFLLYGKSNRLWSKKIAAVAFKREERQA